MKSKINKESFKQIHQTLMVVNLKSTKGKKKSQMNPLSPQRLGTFEQFVFFYYTKD